MVVESFPSGGLYFLPVSVSIFMASSHEGIVTPLSLVMFFFTGTAWHGEGNGESTLILFRYAANKVIELLTCDTMWSTCSACLVN